MEIPVGGDIGDEVHTVDQILIFTSGKARATVAGKDQDVSANGKWSFLALHRSSPHATVSSQAACPSTVCIASHADHL